MSHGSEVYTGDGRPGLSLIDKNVVTYDTNFIDVSLKNRDTKNKNT